MLRRHHDERHRDVGRFDEWAGCYDEHWLQKWLFDPVQRTVIDAALQFRPDAAAVLDLGCGTGQLLRRARDAFSDARLVGVDASTGMIEAARRGGDDEIEFIVGEAEALPFRDGAFDLVFTTLSFHHWHDQREGLLGILRVLRPGGVFVLSDLVLQLWMRPFAVLVGARDRTHTLAEFRAMLLESGFATLRAKAVPRTSHAVYVMAARR